MVPFERWSSKVHGGRSRNTRSQPSDQHQLSPPSIQIDQHSRQLLEAAFFTQTEISKWMAPRYSATVTPGDGRNLSDRVRSMGEGLNYCFSCLLLTTMKRLLLSATLWLKGVQTIGNPFYFSTAGRFKEVPTWFGSFFALDLPITNRTRKDRSATDAKTAAIVSDISLLPYKHLTEH